MSYFCMHAPAADGHAAAQMPAGAGRGVPAGAAPGPPRQLQHPQPWGGHTQHSLHPRMRHHQQTTLLRDTYPAVPTWSRGPRRLLPSPSTLRTPHPCPRYPNIRRGLQWAGSQPHIPEPTVPCAAGLCRRGSGAARLHRRFFPHKLRPRRKPAPGKKINSAAWQGCKRPALMPHARRGARGRRRAPGTRLGATTPVGSWGPGDPRSQSQGASPGRAAAWN